MKTPKEKASELVESNLEVLCSNSAEYELEFFKSRAKKCAINTVDEILKALESDWSFMEVRQEFWQEVKEEIK